MTATILPFGRAAQGPLESRPDLPLPPLVISYRRWFDGKPCGCELLGSREALIAWGVVTATEFPEGRKRKQYNADGRPTVSRTGTFSTDDLFEVRFHINGFTGPEQEAELHRMLASIRAHSSSCENEANKRLSALWDLRQALFFVGHSGRDYDPAHLRAFDELTDRLTQTVASALHKARDDAKQAAQS